MELKGFDMNCREDDSESCEADKGKKSAPTGDKWGKLPSQPVFTGALTIVGLLVGVGGAWAIDVRSNMAGSVQLDYLHVFDADSARDFVFDGFTTELSLKLVTDFGDRTSAHVKVCYGCHGFEIGMAYVDFWLLDELSVRVGRMNPRFGDFPLRHDPANHRANSKPLPYDMGRMLRRAEWNNGILPIPYVDNGIEVYGTYWFNDRMAVDYAIHAVSGLKGNNDAFDIDFVQSRSPSLYYIDNNSQPSVGGRLAVTINIGNYTTLTTGASGIHGFYDPAATQSYLILGIDTHLKMDALVLRAEVLLRRTEFGIPDEPGAFRFDTQGRTKDFFIKQGFLAEVEYPFSEWLEIFARVDGLRRIGNLATNSPLRGESAVLRYTNGINLVVHRSLRLKLSTEIWDFSDFRDEVVAHVGVAGHF
ncbi:MAG: hypothetical protein KTR25_01130 [Myxococcales bacterium]|nr:hypothetical protein [Myxococcales bacterium]